MTISANNSPDLSVSQICEAAYRLAGLLNEHQTMPEASGRVARTFLDLILKGLQAKKIPARTESFYLLGPLTADQYKYELPENVLDVIGTPMYLPADTVDTDAADSERPIQRIDQETWQTIAVKSNTADQVFRCYVHRAVGPIEAWFWPIPSEAGYVRFRVQRLFPSVANGGNTVDLDRPWGEFLVRSLAHSLCMANSQPLQKTRYLKDLADESFRECSGFGEEHVDSAFYVYHPTAWSR